MIKVCKKQAELSLLAAPPFLTIFIALIEASQEQINPDNFI
jgi:hypothetical protein